MKITLRHGEYSGDKLCFGEPQTYEFTAVQNVEKFLVTNNLSNTVLCLGEEFIDDDIPMTFLTPDGKYYTKPSTLISHVSTRHLGTLSFQLYSKECKVVMKQEYEVGCDTLREIMKLADYGFFNHALTRRYKATQKFMQSDLFKFDAEHPLVVLPMNWKIRLEEPEKYSHFDLEVHLGDERFEGPESVNLSQNFRHSLLTDRFESKYEDEDLELIPSNVFQLYDMRKWRKLEEDNKHKMVHDRYMEVGRRIDLTSESMSAIIELIKTVKTQYEDPNLNNLPYITCIAPSGSGKSQLFYTLKAQNVLNAIRIVTIQDSYWGKDAENIHMDYYKVSYEFKTSCLSDYMDLSKLIKKKKDLLLSHKVFSEKSIRNVPLMSFGYIVANLSISAKTSYARSCLNLRLDEPIPDIEEISLLRHIPLSYSQALNEIRRIKEEADIPVVFFDGFRDCKNLKLGFARNLFRALGVVCVTTGSDPKVLNLHTPEEKQTIPWAYVIHRLPTPTIQSLVDYEKCMELLSQVQPIESYQKFKAWLETVPCWNSRIINLALKELLVMLTAKTVDTFPDFFNALIKKVYDRLEEPGCFEIAVLASQIAMNYGMWRGQEQTGLSLSPELCRRHYARLKPPKSGLSFFPVSLEQEGFSSEGNPWQPSSYFPACAGNDLFYLALINSKSKEFYYWNRMNTAVGFKEYTQRVKPALPNDDGTHFEQFCQMAFMAASRTGDHTGIPMSKFLRQLYIQLDPYIELHRTFIKAEDDLPIDGKIEISHPQRMPFLGPVDAEFSDALKRIPELFVRNIITNSVHNNMAISRLDIEPICIIEARNTKSDLSNSKLADIITSNFINTFANNADPSIAEFLFVFTMNTSERIHKDKMMEHLIKITPSILEHRQIIINRVYYELGTLYYEESSIRFEKIVLNLSDEVIKAGKKRKKNVESSKKPAINVFVFPLATVFGSSYDIGLAK